MSLRIADFNSNLAPDLNTIVPHSRVVGLSRVGVEIELENIPHPPARLKYWSVKHDGSLRNNGVEFVFAQPLGGEAIVKAIEELSTALHGCRPDGSWRTSTHIHVDVRDLTIKQLRNFILLYVGYEPVLFQLHGVHRMHSIFCPAVEVAKHQEHILSALINCQEETFWQQDFGEKYSSINVRAIPTFGSIEFRGSEAKWNHLPLLRLVNRLLCLKQLAVSHDEKDYDSLINIVVKSSLRDIFGASVPRLEPDIGFDRAKAELSMRDVAYLASVGKGSGMKRPKPAIGRPPEAGVARGEPLWVAPTAPLTWNTPDAVVRSVEVNRAFTAELDRIARGEPVRRVTRPRGPDEDNDEEST